MKSTPTCVIVLWVTMSPLVSPQPLRAALRSAAYALDTSPDGRAEAYAT